MYTLVSVVQLGHWCMQFSEAFSVYIVVSNEYTFHSNVKCKFM